jgi:hypothetical protein
MSARSLYRHVCSSRSGNQGGRDCDLQLPTAHDFRAQGHPIDSHDRGRNKLATIHGQKNTLLYFSEYAAILLCDFGVFLPTVGFVCRETVRFGVLKNGSNICEDDVNRVPEIACIIGRHGRFKQWNSSVEKPLRYIAQENSQMAANDTVIAAEQPDALQHYFRGDADYRKGDKSVCLGV